MTLLSLIKSLNVIKNRARKLLQIKLYNKNILYTDIKQLQCLFFAPRTSNFTF